MNSKRIANRAGVALAAAISSLIFTALPASADRPVDSHNGGLLTIVCDDLGSFEAGYTTAGEWFHAAQPRLIVDSTLVLVAYAFHYQFTPIGEDLIEWEGGKQAPRNGRLDRCVTTIEESDGSVFVGTYWVSYNGPR